MQCHCPGNIRELQKYLARGVILSSGGVFRPEPLEAACQRASWKLGGARGAPARLGLKRTTHFYQMKRLGIAPPADRLQDSIASAGFSFG
jgi:transcriptional regulator of acetoin/glycerol metabolism